MNILFMSGLMNFVHLILEGFSINYSSRKLNSGKPHHICVNLNGSTKYSDCVLSSILRNEVHFIM
jgi:hypothetical protein